MAKTRKTAGDPAQAVPEAARNIFLATIGAASLIAERASEVFEDLVKRGELAQKNMDRKTGSLTRNVRESSEIIRKKAKEAVQKASDSLRF